MIAVRRWSLWHLITLLTFVNSQIIKEQFQYIPPTYPINNPNITAASVFILSYTENRTVLASPDVFHSIGTVCAMKRYNEGKLQKINDLKLTATFNLESYSTYLGDEGIGYEFMNMLRSDFVYTKNGSSAGTEKYLNPIGILLGNSITMKFLDYVPYFINLPIPSISYGFPPLSKAFYTTEALDRKLIQNYYYDISAPSGSNFVIAGKQLLDALNWSLVAPIFSRDDFGFYGEKYLQSVQYYSSKIKLVCPTSLTDFIVLEGQSVLEDFVSCIKNVDTVSVVWLWMNIITAYNTIKWFRDQGHFDLNFIVYTEKDSDFSKIVDLKILENVIYFIPLSDPEIEETFDSCVADLSEKSDKSYFGQLAKFVYQCSKNESVQFPNCNLNNPEETCNCNENLTNLYKTNLNFFALAFDSVSIVANAISLLQNNCTHLNEALKENDQLNPINFCSLTTFDPFILGQAMRAVNFLGLSGPISFDTNQITRKTANLVVKQFNSNATAVDIGIFVNGILKLNTSRLTFKTIPISEIVVQIPNLSYWFVAVFFGITCFLIFIDLLIWAIITYNRNDAYIKRCSPFFMALMTLGILLVLISNILLSIGLDSSAMCILTNFFLLSGVALIVANILAKNYRVYKIFSNVKAKALTMKDTNLFGFTIVIVGITWMMWAVTSFADGPIKIVIDRGVDNPFYVFGVCRAESQGFQNFQVIFWYTYFIILFCLSGFLGFLTRNVNHIFNESTNVTITAFGYIAFVLIFGPLYYIQSNTTNSNNTRVAIQALSVCFLAGMTMSLLHLPILWKFYRIKRRRNGR